MEIFYKCSFRSSHGFSIGKYDTDTRQLTYISEKSDATEYMPEKIRYTLSHQIGSQSGFCLLLATDENGDLFFGVYRLTDENNDKYVNAVFSDTANPQKVIKVYEYFCRNLKTATAALSNSVQRSGNDGCCSSNLEYIICDDIIGQLLKDMLSDSDIKKSNKTYGKNLLLSFITSEEYSDYQIILEEGFSVKKMKLVERCNFEEQNIAEQFNHNALPLPILIGGGIGAIALIIIILLFL